MREWQEEITPAAYGLLGLLPWEIGRCTTAELAAMLEAAMDRQDEMVELLAWHCANLMNASGNLKQPMTVVRLLNRPTRAMRKKKLAKESGDGA